MIIESLSDVRCAQFHFGKIVAEHRSAYDIALSCFCSGHNHKLCISAFGCIRLTQMHVVDRV